MMSMFLLSAVVATAYFTCQCLIETMGATGEEAQRPVLP